MIIDKLFKSGISAILGSVSGLVDKVVTNKAEKEKLKIELEKELTRRLIIDSQSDSWLSRNIRPLTLLIIVLSFVVILFFKIDANPELVKLFKSWGGIAIAFYFGSRGIEKLFKGKK